MEAVMAAKKKKKEKNLVSQLQDGVVDGSKDIWLAGLGALATVEEEGSKVFDNLVNKGKERESKGKKQIEGALDNLKKKREEVSTTFEGSISTLEEQLSSVFERFGVPSKKEMESLASKVDTLNKNVQALAQKMDKQEKEKSENKEKSSSK